ncbi:MAG: hypothetical protein IJT69_03595 [Clostridia bacterium]|nr:hypothetical protein [Clostridia bacterium]
MKKIIVLILLLFLISVAAFGCHLSTRTDVADPMPVVIAPVEEQIDLTTMNQTMAYARLSEMFYDKDSYQGSVVRALGRFSVNYVEKYSEYQPALIVGDETGCCVVVIGLQFKSGINVPQDLPPDGSTVIVEGVFGKTDRFSGIGEICCLSDAEVTVSEYSLLENRHFFF